MEPGPRALLKGERLLRDGNYPQAIEHLQMAVRLLPKTAQAHNLLGVAYHQSRQLESALKCYRQAILLDNNLASARFNLGCLLLEMNDPVAAADQLTSYTFLDPDSAPGWHKLGVAQLRARRPDQAESSLRQSLKLEPKNVEAWNILGTILYQRRKPQDALGAFNRALTLSSNYAPAVLNTAVLLHQASNNRRAALPLYRRYLALSPKSPHGNAIAATVAELDHELNPPPIPLVAITAAPPAIARGAMTAAPPAIAQGTSTGTLSTTVRGAVTAAPPAVAQGIATTAPPSSVQGALTAASSNQVRGAATGAPPQMALTQPTNPPSRPLVSAATNLVGGSSNRLAVTPPATNLTSPSRSVTSAPPAKEVQTAASVGTSNKVALTEQLDSGPLSTNSIPLEVTQLPDDLIINVPQDIATPAAPKTNAMDAPLPEPSPASAPAEVTGEEKPTRRSLLSRLNPFRPKTKSPPAKETLTPPSNPPPYRIVTPPAIEGPATNTVPKTVSAPPKPKLPKPVYPRYSYMSPPKPAPGNRAQADKLFTRALEYQRVGIPDEAASQYLRATQLDPSYFEAHYNLGLVAYELRDWTLCLQSFETALALRPDSIDARYNFAQGLRKAGHPDDAAVELKKILGKNPKEARAHLSLAYLYAYELREPELARIHFQKLLELEPNHPQASEARSWIASQK